MYFQFKAAVRTFNPKEKKYMQPEPRFKIAVGHDINTNLDRAHSLGLHIIGRVLRQC